MVVGSFAALLPLVLLPAALRLRRDTATCREGGAFTTLLVRTFKLELMFSVLLSLGLVGARALG